MKKIVKLMKNWKVKLGAGGAALNLMLINSALAAPNTDQITKPITNLTDVMVAIAGAIGGVVLVWGIINIAMAIHSEQTSEVSRHLKTIAAGGLLAGAGLLYAILL